METKYTELEMRALLESARIYAIEIQKNVYNIEVGDADRVQHIHRSCTETAKNALGNNQRPMVLKAFYENRDIFDGIYTDKDSPVEYNHLEIACDTLTNLCQMFIDSISEQLDTNQLNNGKIDTNILFCPQ